MRREEILDLLNDDEIIKWEGKPDKKCMILESAFNPLLPFAILWLFFDSFAIFYGVLPAVMDGAQELLLFIIPFFAIHLMPVWIYLGGLISSVRRFKSTYYVVTNKTIYISNNKQFSSRDIKDIGSINIHQGRFDKRLGVGDIEMGRVFSDGRRKTMNFSIEDISEFNKVYRLIKEIKEDGYSDVSFNEEYRHKEKAGAKDEDFYI